MLFNSYVFVFLMLPISVAGYYLFNKISEKAGIFFLLLCSFLYIGYMNPAYLYVLIPSILVNYLLFQIMNTKCKGNIIARKLVLATGIIFDVGLLAYFKYADFFIETMNELLSKEYSTLKLLVPLGISFYTFQQISFLVDTYRDESIKCSFDEYALYITFYPQFVQGPIVLQDEFIPQLRDKTKKNINIENISKGMYRFILGLAKKVLIADSIALVVDAGYNSIDDIAALSSLVLIIGYTLQIYFDFSAYSDMAVGLGGMFNIELPENFDSPYKANNIDEFWERWHITLTRFLTRYLYFPLGGSKKGKVRTYINIMLVFLISGLWHGAEWSFVIWGAVHGIAKVVRRIKRDLGKTQVKQNWISRVITFLYVSIAWVFFRAKTTLDAVHLLSCLFKGEWRGLSVSMYESFSKLVEVSWLLRLDVLGIRNHVQGLVVIVIFSILTVMCFIMANTREIVNRWSKKPGTKHALMIGVLFAWCILSFNGVTNFIYWSF